MASLTPDALSPAGLAQQLTEGTLTKGGHPAAVLHVTGSPRSGKTELCYHTFVSEPNAQRVRDGKSYLIVSHRLKADELSNRAIQDIENSVVTRPVKTLVALAFEILKNDRASRKLTPPKLLDGAEQDQLIRGVLRTHQIHVSRGDDEDCATCALLKRYFAVTRQGSRSTELEVPQTTEEIFEQMITPAFASQLRDMFARLSELHFHIDDPEALDRYESAFPTDSRRRVEWDVASALRSEYAQAVSQEYPSEFRVDNAFVLVAAQESLERRGDTDSQATRDSDELSGSLPEVVIVDDAQELTLAGFSFLQTLVARGTRLLLAGNNDESVQTFRGAYPEVLSELVDSEQGMSAVHVELPAAMLDSGVAPDYRTAVASRVSQAIGSVMVNDVPVPRRAGKLVASNANEKRPDDSLSSRLFRSKAEELDDLVWQVKSARFNDELEWGGMGIIAHDNSTLQAIGKRFEEENIPVQYSSVSRPLKEESVVQGLLAMLRLVSITLHVGAKSDGRGSVGAGQARAIRDCLDLVVTSPLFSVRTAEGLRPIRMGAIKAALTSIAVLEGVEANSMSRDSGTQDSSTSQFADLRQEWQRLSGAQKVAPIGVDGLFALLVLGDDAVRRHLVRILDSMVGSNRRGSERRGQAASQRPGWETDVAALRGLIEAVRLAANEYYSKPEGGVYSALWYVWDACGVAQEWQEMSLSQEEEGRSANRLLDTVIRLFNHAVPTDATATQSNDESQSPRTETIAEFIDRIDSLEIEADSLAKVAPVEDAVSLCTPAGAAGAQWTRVWIPSMQQDVWPNLAPRNTLFGAEVLADTVLSARLRSLRGEDSEVSSPAILDSAQRRLATLYAELKSFLVALSRAATVSVSAVLSETSVPSEFLYAFLPESFSMETVGEPVDYTAVGQTGDGADSDQSDGIDGTTSLGGLDVTSRGVISLARARLARYFTQTESENQDPKVLSTQEGLSPDVKDAAEALAYLMKHHVAGANPDQWSFADTTQPDSDDGQSSESDFETEVTLSPSSVDRIWQCPLRWALENKYNGPSQMSAATSFGTMIHDCAQDATELHLDQTASYDELLNHMLAHYAGLRAQQDRPDAVEDQYAVERKNQVAQEVLGNIATYFVESRNALYGIDDQGKPAKNELPPAGKLVSSEAEKSFRARFNLRSILPMVSNALGEGSTDAAEVAAALTALADGFDAEFAQEATITLSGRIDRVEHRSRDGKQIVNVVDYKTGQKHGGPSIFSDLQLVCYQLGLAFPQDSSDAQLVERSMLFDVEHATAPATNSYGIEISYQPALFASNDTFNTAYRPRPHLPKMDSSFKQTDTYPQAFAAMKRLEEVASQEGNDQLMWCLSMISRVFYAAGYRQAHSFVPKRGAVCTYCAFKGVCPAWPEESETVLGQAAPTQLNHQKGEGE